MASSDELPAYRHDPRRNMQTFVPPDARRVLDVGCHAGDFGAALKADRGVEVWGLEPNAEAAASAATRLDCVITAPFSDAAVPNAHFDALVFNDVLEHLVDPWAALRVAARKLAPGGVVVASIPNLLEINNLLHLLRERDFRYEARGIRDRTHLRFFTRTSALRLFDESGFDVLCVAGINEQWWTPSLKRRLAFRLFGRFLDETRYLQFAIVGRPRLDSTASASRH